MLREQSDLRGARALPTKVEKGAFVMDALRSTAERSQKPLLDFLAARGAEHRPFWVANMIWVRGSASLVEELASRGDVFHIYANPKVRFDGPVASRPAPAFPSSPDAIEWGVMKVRAPEVWALGFTGQGIVVGGQDTGYEWDHPALKLHYRGWLGLAANHNYNWHDAIHSGGGSCGADSDEPCDDHSHGTHTMGTMVGDDGFSNQIGVAPGAKWIGCRNMDQGAGTPTTYAECFEWFIAPTNLANANPDPSKAPHVINNSWGCPPSEGCTDPAILQTVVENTRAAGIEVVVSAGNAGSGCETVADPAAIYDASFSIGATNSGDNIASFSSRGPVTIDGSGRMKPDISAPGEDVRSSVPGGSYASFSGTSMAGPHIAGVVALVLSASPGLVGNPDAIEPALTSSAVPRTSAQTCGGVPGSAIPNNTYGWGRADALAALAATGADVAVSQTGAPDLAIPGAPVTYVITVSNLGPAQASDVHVDEVLSLSVAINSATPSQGSCTVGAHSASCDLGSIASGAGATITVVTHTLLARHRDGGLERLLPRARRRHGEQCVPGPDDRGGMPASHAHDHRARVGAPRDSRPVGLGVHRGRPYRHLDSDGRHPRLRPGHRRDHLHVGRPRHDDASRGRRLDPRLRRAAGQHPDLGRFPGRAAGASIPR